MYGQTKDETRGIMTWARTSVAAAALFALFPMQTAAAGSADEIRAMRAQMATMAKRLEQLETQQAGTRKDVEANKSAGFRPGSKLGTFLLPGTDSEVEISGYVKGDFIYDVDEATGDVFVPEAISTSGPDEQRFRAHARQIRLAVKTSTPTAWGPLKTHVEGDFFGGGGNEVFSNSSPFRLRHAYGTVGPVLVGQTWSNFMPIESYPTTVDFNGPAGIPFIRQAQFHYTTPIYDRLKFSASVENSEFSGRNAAGPISESINLGIRAGVDVAPDVTAALTYADDWGLIKLAGVGRYLGSPNSIGDDELG
ncbi:DcaP family trimeric outer membrane transporter [Aurantimonas sp. C2-6-R+9]|uniref:DcaP family trimeric outer membrane transporter n=1 Tax=unclassified Aurantimonas TaxID=2638230 RepID=UPI002E18E2A3|nr:MULTISPECIES: DcaP family trimeric outer membrane transporter [unclassified Aurantimonas]MEC5293182.1 DcaP family trimeric outer membrane transporter [Aurantimonas sp. C2-3-R2]MEC5383328.1 DcaP family trimeric outer membrane transporter [Aurantimonas sp. C2-6-R+9]MEC5414277.1 DcaP family trimeric outer membrane transporter [Aurantimonas sp. C2-4-R8]